MLISRSGTWSTWKRRHIGFITVHAGLIMLIAGGFWSFFGRVEGHVALSEGESSNVLELDHEVIEIADVRPGTPAVRAPAPRGPALLNLGGVDVQVLARWADSREQAAVVNLNPTPFRAVEIGLDLASDDARAVAERVSAFQAQRRATQPLAEPNAGSVFRNPPDGYAARLIESCGLKGHRIGGAQVSVLHANFIVNAGDASARDIESLIGLVQETVARKTGVHLEREVRIVGEAAA